MGRPREHDERTATALLEAAERTIQEHGVAAVSVRRLADDVGTTTRAVYSLFGSKDGLMVALAARAFELLGAAVHDLPTTDDPAGDLVAAGADVFRPFALGHPILFRVGVQRGRMTAGESAEPFRAARMAALAQLEARIERLGDAGLGHRPIRQAAFEFHALCEGLAGMELRSGLPPGRADALWRDALGALVAGFARTRPVPPAAPPQRRGRRPEGVRGGEGSGSSQPGGRESSPAPRR
jgi:AcrR family transcriptional regulator